MFSRVIGLGATSLAIAVVPTAAFAVAVSSGSGSGYQSVTQAYGNGWKATGKLKSTSGNKVYYQGKVVYDGTTDDKCGRYTSNTTSLTLVTRGGTCVETAFRLGTADAGAFKICRDIPGPDLCGPWAIDRF